MKVVLSVLLLGLILSGRMKTAAAQPIHLLPMPQGEPDILALTAGPDHTSELVRFKSTGEKITSKLLPFAALAVCPEATGFVVAPADGGLAYLDDKMLLKVRIPGMVYESLVCAGTHVYASGRSLRVHRFDYPSLLNRLNLFEANSWVPRLFSPKAGLLAGASWDGSIILWTIADRTRRTLPGKTSLLDLVAGPNDTWISLSDEGQITTLRDNGTELHHFRARGARRLMLNSEGVLAVLSGVNTIVLYRQSGSRWVEYRRMKTGVEKEMTHLVFIGRNRWAALSEAGLSFFTDTP